MAIRAGDQDTAVFVAQPTCNDFEVNSRLDGIGTKEVSAGVVPVLRQTKFLAGALDGFLGGVYRYNAFVWFRRRWPACLYLPQESLHRREKRHGAWLVILGLGDGEHLQFKVYISPEYRWLGVFGIADDLSLAAAGVCQHF